MRSEKQKHTIERHLTPLSEQGDAYVRLKLTKDWNAYIPATTAAAQKRRASAKTSRRRVAR
jgi:hypothetical protein